ncbi:hypothetical protein PUN28_002475 [Cardiocondyla obscurior]|uniref:Uncharacterized protein n=1 Tax=Cardiocondyla obscurior TaxID=286306 RepID=A0AAW2GUC9_9HYME
MHQRRHLLFRARFKDDEPVSLSGFHEEPERGTRRSLYFPFSLCPIFLLSRPPPTASDPLSRAAVSLRSLRGNIHLRWTFISRLELRLAVEYMRSIHRSRITREEQEASRFRKQVFALRPLLRFFRFFGLVTLYRVVCRKRHYFEIYPMGNACSSKRHKQEPTRAKAKKKKKKIVFDIFNLFM